MILRKPYAILIKYFKLIHIILTLLMFYATFKMKDIYDFFDNYINAGWLSINAEEAKSYINSTCYISIILILIILIVIFWLMRIKKKPNLYYKITIPVYIIILTIFIVLSNALNSAITEVISPLNLLIYSDTALITFLVQSTFLVVPILRGIGFDVKKFNFKKDIADLQIENIDNEEVELNINIDKNKIKRNLNRIGRNSSYIFLKNKIIIYRILLILLIISLGYFIINVFITNKTYKEKTIIQLDKYSLKVNKSYLTLYNYNNKVISTKYKYVVVNFTPINKINNNTFDLDKIDLKIGDKYYYPETNIYTDFKDLGYGYNGQTLGTKNNLDYIMVFKLPLEQKTNRVILRYINSTKFKNNEQIKIYKNIKLNLNDDTKKVININSNIGNNININFNTFKVDKYELSNIFNYTYENCDSDNVCNNVSKSIGLRDNNYTIMKLSGTFKLENKGVLKYYDNYDEYFKTMIYIKYKVNNVDKKFSGINSLTPTKLLNNNNEMYLEVPQEINNASDINLHIKNRNVDYNIKLK